MNLDHILPLVTRPGRYTGGEWNMNRKDWDSVSVRIVLAFPDLYEIGMSHQGLQILYDLINRQADFLAERVYAPAPDMEELLRKKKVPIFSLESRRPLVDFDVLGITLPYELCITNILTILDLAHIPFLAAERDRDFPLVIGGGPCAFNPEPIADFFDAILLGDGEEAVIEIAREIKDWKAGNGPKDELLGRLSEMSGVYIPAFFKPHHDKDGNFQSIEPLRAGYERVKKRVLPKLLPDLAPLAPLVPNAKTVHDRLGVEIARGCTRGCRFCQAGMIYRPVRERSPNQVLDLACRGVKAGGFEELALLSLSTGDYSHLPDVLLPLMDQMTGRHVSVSLPSMRVGSLTQEIMEQIRRVRKTGFTLAPEAGTDRLRRVINKGITEADLLEASKAAFGLGWKLLKFYFMFGLPTETDDDIEAIADLVRKAQAQAPNKKGRINVSVGTFVPKSHTPFQWEEQMGISRAFERIDSLKQKINGRGAALKWNDPRMSFLEGVFARGDRRLGAVVIEAWKRGARLDSWSDHFELERWKEAAAACGVMLDPFLQAREIGGPLPWQHLELGLAPDFLEDERQKSLSETYTPDCRVHGCQKCGLCDFKIVRPMVYAKPWLTDKVEVQGQARSLSQEILAAPAIDQAAAANSDTRPVYKISYSRQGEARFNGHLEFLQLFFRACRRAEIPLAFSKGFHPTPIVSFSPALPLGTASLAEYVLAELTELPADLDSIKDALNNRLPESIRILKVERAGHEKNESVLTGYRITLAKEFAPQQLEKTMQAESLPVTLIRKRKKRRIDAKTVVNRLVAIDDHTLELDLVTTPGKAGIKPMELIQAVLDLDDEAMLTAGVLKLWFRDFDEGIKDPISPPIVPGTI